MRLAPSNFASLSTTTTTTVGFAQLNIRDEDLLETYEQRLERGWKMQNELVSKTSGGETEWLGVGGAAVAAAVAAAAEGQIPGRSQRERRESMLEQLVGTGHGGGLFCCGGNRRTRGRRLLPSTPSWRRREGELP